jgi:amidase
MSPLRVGVVRTARSITPIGQEQAAAVASAARILEGAGHMLVDVAADRIAGVAAEALRCAAQVLSVSLADWLDSLEIPDDEVSPLAAAVAADGRAKPATALLETTRRMALLSRQAWSVFADVDILITPMLSGPPPPVGAFPMTETDTRRHWAAIGSLAPYAAFANVTGFPALSVPHGCDASGLPLAVQLLGPMGDDHRLLATAGILAASRPWSHRRTIAGGQ